MLESFTTDKFTYKRLSPEEQKERGILGRLVGIIADTKNATRNGRKYSIDLWKHVFDDPVMKEKIANRCVFSELGHPADREEIDMEKVCACLAEQPKVGDDGKLYGVFDILDTNNGRILKTLCDYGTTVGISSRGTGDLYTDELGEEAVDPDTYNCECFDIVIVPAVEAARLQYVTEALDTKKYNKTLKQKISEQLEKASDDDRKIMTESLENLGLKESIMYKGYGIDKDIYGQGEYSVQVNGDDMMFDSVEEAKKFIDELPEEDQIEEGFKVIGKDLKGNVIHNYEVDTEEEAKELKKDLDNNANLTAGVHPTETVDIVKESLTEEIDMQKEIAEEQREDQVGVFSQGLKPGAELKTTSGHRIKIRDINVKFVDGKPEVYFKYDFITNRGKQGSGTNDSAGFYKLLSEDVEMPEGEALVEEVVNDKALDAVKDDFVQPMAKEVDEAFNDKVDQKINGMIEYLANAFDEAGYTAEEVLDDVKGACFNANVNALDLFTSLYENVKAYLDESISESCGDKKEVMKEDVDIVKEDSELQEMLVKASELEKDNLSLQEKLSVCIAKEAQLEEELNRYKDGMAQLSESAKEAKSLKEALDQKTKVIESSRVRVENLIQSKKAANEKAKQSSELVENLNNKVESLTNELNEANANLTKYKKALKESKDKYLEAKANAIGVHKEEIVQNLHESYSFKNIDSVCNALVEQKKTLNKLPFKLNENSKISVTGKKDYISRQQQFDDDDDVSGLMKMFG